MSDTAALSDAIRNSLTDDLLKPEYRARPDRVRSAGHCYAASEAAYHILGGKDAGWTPMQIKHEGDSHWFLKHNSGQVLDPTADQFKTPVPYDNAVGRGFLTSQPSKRAQTIMDRANGNQKTAAFFVRTAVREWAGHDQAGHPQWDESIDDYEAEGYASSLAKGHQHSDKEYPADQEVDKMQQPHSINPSSTFWHGSASNDYTKHGKDGLHIGTYHAAKQALGTFIGHKADGTDWDGTSAWGDTKLMGQKSQVAAGHRERINAQEAYYMPMEDYTPNELHPGHVAHDTHLYSGGKMDPAFKPNLFPVQIKPEHQQNLHPDLHSDVMANETMMLGQHGGKGMVYLNNSEDQGSASIALPHHSMIQRVDPATVQKPVARTEFGDALSPAMHEAMKPYHEQYQQQYGKTAAHGDHLKGIKPRGMSKAYQDDAEEATKQTQAPKLAPVIPINKNVNKRAFFVREALDYGHLYGKGFDALFTGDGPMTGAPFQNAGRMKNEPLFDKDAVNAAVSSPNPTLKDFDPRTLAKTQPMVTRGGVAHYMNNSSLFDDANQSGNQHPVVYTNKRGQDLILSGHHRATKALLAGEPLKAIHVMDPAYAATQQRAAFFVRAAVGTPFTMMNMHPNDLTPHAMDRLSDPSDLRHVNVLADSMKQHGYDQAKGAAYTEGKGQYSFGGDSPITLWHQDNGSYLSDGNHRAWAAQKAGLQSVPVKVYDTRTTQPKTAFFVRKSALEPHPHAFAGAHPAVKTVKDQWSAQFNHPTPQIRPAQQSVEEAKAYHTAPDASHTPEMQKSYKSLIDSVGKQYNDLRANGISYSPHQGEGEPYKDSESMRSDLTKGHVKYLPTATAGELSDNHPMRQTINTVDGPMMANDAFRAVHDTLGHGFGASFGPLGEQQAWMNHRATLPADSHAALYTETRGQNVWTNYGPHMQDQTGNLLPKEQRPGLADRPFAPQKQVYSPHYAKNWFVRKSDWMNDEELPPDPNQHLWDNHKPPAETGPSRQQLQQAAHMQLKQQGYQGDFDQASRRAFVDHVDQHYTQAEQATNGYLLNPTGIAKKVDPKKLFHGNPAIGNAYASEELKDHWNKVGRPEYSSFREGLISGSGSGGNNNARDWQRSAFFVRKSAAHEYGKSHYMPVEDFTETYQPAEYDAHGLGWEGVEDHPSFLEQNPFNPERIHGGTWHNFVQDVGKNGIKEPVEVDPEYGEVISGHHRVVAAMKTGVPVHYTYVDTSQPYVPEDQPPTQPKQAFFVRKSTPTYDFPAARDRSNQLEALYGKEDAPEFAQNSWGQAGADSKHVPKTQTAWETHCAVWHWAAGLNRCREMRKAAWALLGEDINTLTADPHVNSDTYGKYNTWDLNEDPQAFAVYAYTLMKGIHDAPVSNRVAYRGLSDVGNVKEFLAEIEEESTFEMPLVAFSTREASTNEFGSEFHFVLDPGSKGVVGINMAREGSSKGPYYEYITGGTFKVTGVKYAGKRTQIHIKQVEVFDPDKIIDARSSS